MSKPMRIAGIPALAALDRRVLFLGTYALVAVIAVIFHGLVLSWLSDVSAAKIARMTEATRMDRIVKQEWWVDDNDKLALQVSAIRSRFWKGETIGIVRADLERFLQDVLTRNELQASNVLIEPKATDVKGIAMIRAQMKFTGPTIGTLKLLNDLAAGPNEIFISGVNIRFFKEQVTAELNLDAPTIVGGK